ncbi:unnamed protein product [Trichogramma brassicae]|uniref:F-box domain-containing protein n=1 Tax=Trichogramma brassicae TaxID=86971 RepID=A0A6H5J2S5_9HYME|nr:unnamed protein product [Trichogramma brassicae]
MERKQENEGRKEITKSESEESWEIPDIANMKRKQENEGRKEITKSESEESWEVPDIANMERKQENEGRKEIPKSVSEESWEVPDIANMERKQENEGRKEIPKSVSGESWEMVAAEVDALKIEDEETQPSQGQVKKEEKEVEEAQEPSQEEEKEKEVEEAQEPSQEEEKEKEVEEAQEPSQEEEKEVEEAQEPSQEEEGEKSIFDRLNEDCMIEVFQHLSIRNRLQLRRVCKKWRHVINSTWSRTTPRQLYKFVKFCGRIPGGRPKMFTALKEITRHMQEIVFSTAYYSYADPMEEYQIAYILGQNRTLRSLTICVPRRTLFEYFKPLFARPSLRRIVATLDPCYLVQFREALASCRYLNDLTLNVLDFWKADQTWANVERMRRALRAVPEGVARLHVYSSVIFLMPDLFQVIRAKCPDLEDLMIQGGAGQPHLASVHLDLDRVRQAMAGWRFSLRRLRLFAPPPSFDPTCLYELRSLESLTINGGREDFWDGFDKEEFRAVVLRNNTKLDDVKCL